MRKEWKSVGDVLKFWSDNFEDDLEMKNLLMRKIVSEFKNKCGNCQEPVDDCLDGKPLAKGWKDLRVKTTVKLVPESQQYYIPLQTKGVVLEFHDKVVLQSCETTGQQYNMTFSVKWDFAGALPVDFHAATTGIAYDCKE